MPSTKAKSSMKKKTNTMPKKQEQTFQKTEKKQQQKSGTKMYFLFLSEKITRHYKNFNNFTPKNKEKT